MVVLKKRKDSSLSIRMPLVLQKQIKPAVRQAGTKNQTVFIAEAIKTLLRRIHDGATVVETSVPLNQCSLGSDSSMINIRVVTSMLTVLDATATRFYQSTTRLVLWAVALAVHEQKLRLATVGPTAELPDRLSVPEEVGELWDRAAQHLQLDADAYVTYAVKRLLQAIRTDRPIHILGLPKGAFTKTTRNVPVHNPQHRTLNLTPKLAKAIVTTAPQLYHTPSSFVLWAGCWVAFRVLKTKKS